MHFLFKIQIFENWLHTLKSKQFQDDKNTITSSVQFHTIDSCMIKSLIRIKYITSSNFKISVVKRIQDIHIVLLIASSFHLVTQRQLTYPPCVSHTSSSALLYSTSAPVPLFNEDKRQCQDISCSFLFSSLASISLACFLHLSPSSHLHA